MHQPASSRAGWTLVEVMVVLLIIGVLAGLATFNLLLADATKARREAERLAGALQHAAYVAQWRGETLMLSIHRHGYRWWKTAKGGWEPFLDDDLLRDHALPAGLRSELRLRGGRPPVSSQLFFHADGVNEPYELSIVGTEQWRLMGDALNRITLERRVLDQENISQAAPRVVS